jgi:hypothetical protein
MTKRKFYRTVIRVEVLHEDPRALAGDLTLADVHEIITSGGATGSWNVSEGPFVLNGKRMAELLIKEGSDPAIFDLNEKGEYV